MEAIYASSFPGMRCQMPSPAVGAAVDFETIGTVLGTGAGGLFCLCARCITLLREAGLHEAGFLLLVCNFALMCLLCGKGIIHAAKAREELLPLSRTCRVLPAAHGLPPAPLQETYCRRVLLYAERRTDSSKLPQEGHVCLICLASMAETYLGHGCPDGPKGRKRPMQGLSRLGAGMQRRT